MATIIGYLTRHCVTVGDGFNAPSGTSAAHAATIPTARFPVVSYCVFHLFNLIN
ncbi:hypothetical protein [Yersinia rohdei]|uniref:hypothetical protein n=1 Tax=Yersinia rohdei TaxID=29485 RepID=UPI001643A0A9|nr:hypothetical protein [Yersinia rohdei]